MDEPKTYGDSDEFCDPSCPYFQLNDKGDMICTLKNRELDFYDWFLQQCKDEPDY